MTAKRAPKHLSRSARAWFRKVTSGWSLDDSGELLLVTALQAYDRLAECRALIERDGLIVDGKPHPLLAIEDKARTSLLRAWRQLGLDVEPALPTGRPPGS
jgi:P27 family predicted phage terminase small subunit